MIEKQQLLEIVRNWGIDEFGKYIPKWPIQRKKHFFAPYFWWSSYKTGSEISLKYQLTYESEWLMAILNHFEFKMF